MSKLIEELVAQKLKGVSTFASNSAELESEDKPNQKSRRQEITFETAWQQLADEPLYLLEVEIVTGVKQSLAIAGEDLCLDTELVEGLVGGYRSKISKKLVKLRSKLESAQKSLYRQYTIYAAPFRFVRQDSLPEAIAHIEQMQEQAAEYCQELSADYSEQMSAFLADIAARLEKAIPADQPGREQQIEESLMRYAADFPPLEDFERSLSLVLKGPIKLNSLAAQLRADKVLQTELALEERSAAQTRLEAQRLESQRKAEQMLQENLLSAYESSKDASVEEGYELIGSFIDRVDAREAGSLTSRDNDALATLFSRLELLAKHANRLQPLVVESRKLRSLYSEKNPDLSAVQTAVEEFQQFLLQQASKEQSSSQGLQKLTRSLAFSSDYKMLIAELSELANSPDPKRLDELEGKIQSDLDVLSLRQRKLEKLFRAAKAATETEISRPRSVDEAFDSVAGF